MTPLRRPPDSRAAIDGRLVRQMIATTLAGLVVFLSTAFAGAGTNPPNADTGGSGGGSGITIVDMLRGAYSPIFEGPEVAATDVIAHRSVADMLRGDYSPIVIDA